MTGKTITVGAKLPNATLLSVHADDGKNVALAEKLEGRKVVIFGLPGAFTSTCSTAHVPSFIRTAKALAEKGVDEIICLSVNDPFVMEAWGKATGANDAGITMLADADGSFTKAIGMEFDWLPDGFIGRSKRYSMLVEDGVVSRWFPEDKPGCNISAGEHMLAEI
jgi:glutaredoxin/glutathione-dependent peroxiredoxin